MINKKVSIIVPVYNAEKYLSQCIESIINQTYKNLEIILVNDGSKDNSEFICKEYQKKDFRIKLISDINHGVSYARNQGLKDSVGEYVLFVDSDDNINENYVYSLMEKTLEDDYDIVISGYKEFGKEVINVVLSEEKEDLLTGTLRKDYKFLEMFLITPWVKLYKTSIIKKYNIKFPEDFRIGEDQVFNLLYLKYVKKYKFINKPLYNYIRQNNKSLTSIRNIEAYNCEVKLLKKKKEFFYKNNIDDKEYLLGDWLISLTHIYSFILEDEFNNYKSYKKRVNEFLKIVPLNFKAKTLKRKMILFFLKRKIIFPIYFYNYLKKLV